MRLSNIFSQSQNKISHSQEHLDFLKEVKRKKVMVLITQILLLIVIFAAWEVAARIRVIDPFIASQPSKVAETFLKLHSDGSLYRHIGITLGETIIGFLVSTVLGTMIAIILWWSDYLSRVFQPYLVVLNSLPKVALGPIIIVWMGAGISSVITMALLIAIIVTIMGVYNGFQSVSEDKIKMLQTFGANKWQILSKVILPSSIPTIVSALKINVGLSWVGVIMGEFLVSKAGLGYLIVYGGQVFQLDLVMTSVIVLAIIAAVMYQGVIAFEKYLLERRK